MLLDTASLYFRAFFGVPATITAPDGTPVNAVRGLLDFIARLVTDHSPTHLVAAWDDDWRPQFRVDAVPSYKAHRLTPTVDGTEQEEVPDLLTAQVPLIVQALELLGICRLGAPGYEADDVIGTLATTSSSPVVVVTGDRDLFQLIDDQKPIKVLYTAARGVGNAELLDDAAIRQRYGIGADQYADFALLRGDASDGLPGVKGIGDKTAASLIDKYGSVAGLYAAIEDGTCTAGPAVKRNLIAAVDYVGAATNVVQVVRDIDLPVIDAQLPTKPADPQALQVFAEKWNLTSSVERISTALGW